MLESRAHYRCRAAGKSPSELNMEDLLNEETGRDRDDENEKAAGMVTFID